MKRLKKAGAMFIAPVIILIALAVSVQDAHAYAYYTTDEFNVMFDVHEDNSVSVTEEIKIDAFGSGHGIYRYIPVSGSAYMEIDGEMTEIPRRMKIKNINVENYEYETYTENGNMVIRIGSPDYYITGPQVYKITYDCIMYEDRIDSMDFFYYNVIPQGWETSIDKASVTVTMPKEFDAGSVWVYRGAYGYSYDAECSISGNTITVNEEYLPVNEGITLQVNLPDGYFAGAANMNFVNVIMYAAIVLSVLLAAALWYLFGRDPDVVQTVEFYPPDGITPAEAGYIIDGVVNKEDLVSMVIYFADKGYLSIEEKLKKAHGISGLAGKMESTFFLNKLRDIPETEKVFAATLFDGLFESGDRVELSELSGEFYDYYETAMNELAAYYRQQKEKRVYTTSSKFARFVSYILMTVPVFAAVAFSGIAVYDFTAVITAAVIAAVVFIGYLIVIGAYDRKYASSRKSNGFANVLGFVVAGVASGIAIAECAFMYGRVIAPITGVLGSFAAAMLSRIMLKRTDSSANMLGRLLGFKDFIDTAEKDRIELLANENPSYFYGILPYAYVFGLSDKWANKFESIALEPPSWYDGRSVYGGSPVFNTWVFMRTFNSCASMMTQNLTVPPADGGGGIGSGSGGSFGGGGGFSGGGFGGGGGGGW